MLISCEYSYDAAKEWWRGTALATLYVPPFGAESQQAGECLAEAAKVRRAELEELRLPSAGERRQPGTVPMAWSGSAEVSGRRVGGGGPADPWVHRQTGHGAIQQREGAPLRELDSGHSARS